MTTKQLIKSTGMKMPVLAKLCGTSYEVLKNIRAGVPRRPRKKEKAGENRAVEKL